MFFLRLNFDIMGLSCLRNKLLSFFFYFLVERGLPRLPKKKKKKKKQKKFPFQLFAPTLALFKF